MNPASYYLSGVESYPDYVPTPIQIGGQIWDKKNLSTARYRDGTAIPSSGSFLTAQIGLWRYYGNSSTIGAIYGRLYNWYAMVGIWNFASIGDPSLRKNIAPLGWRAATEADWDQLASYVTALSPAGSVGSKLKEVGTAHWAASGGTDLVSFTGLPGGSKSGGDGSFSNLTLEGNFWAYNSSQPRGRNLIYNSINLTTPTVSSYQPGRSIRLIKEDATLPGFTVSISDLTALSITGTGTFGDLPNTPNFIEKGICWSTSSNPNIFIDPYIVDGSTTKTTYSLTASPLAASTTYYIRAYIKVDSTDIRYSTNIVPFTTLSGAPVSISTTAISNVGSTTATSGGTITDNALYPTTQRGVCWNTTGSPTTGNSKTTDTGNPFTSSITGLSVATTYYVRSYCINAAGTFYGNALAPFTTLPSANSKPIFGVYAAYHAYSLRLVGQGYTGYCIRVRRRVSGFADATADVMFNGTSLNSTISMNSEVVPVSGTSATTLGQLAFATGFSNPDGIPANQNIVISTWYDQSGNNKHVIQTGFSNSPFIVTTGNLEIKDGSVAVRFSSASSQTLILADTSVLYNNVSCYAVNNSLSNTANTSAYMLGVSGTNARLFLPQNTSISYNTSNTFPITGITANVDRLYELTCGAATTSAYSNGVQSSVASVPSLNVTSATIRVGGNGSPLSYMNGHIKEVIAMIGDSSLTRTDIETNINTYYSIW